MNIYRYAMVSSPCSLSLPREIASTKPPRETRIANQNAFVERWIGSIKGECLNRFIAFGLNHLDYLVEEYVRYYNELRPHSRKEDKPLLGVWQDNHDPPAGKDQIVCHERLGGVLKHYECQAA